MAIVSIEDLFGWLLNIEAMAVSYSRNDLSKVFSSFCFFQFNLLDKVIK